LKRKKNVTPLFAEKFPLLNLLHHALDQSYDAVSNEPCGPSFFGVLIYSGKQHTMIHYLENKVGVVDFANAQGMVMFQSPRARPGPRAMKFYHSAGFCKIYYSHFIFEVMTFLRKIQN
jgi:hypothetical protein